MKNIFVAVLIAALCVGVAYAEEPKAPAKAVVKAEVQVKADAKADPRSNPETALAEAIRLLEAKEYLAMVKNFVPPEELKQVLTDVTVEQFAAQWGQNGAPRMLNILKGIKDVTPMAMGDAKLIFRVPAEVDKEVKVVWLVKVDGFWYITNR